MSDINKYLAHARKMGLSATFDHVNQYYDWYRRWYMGLIATGHLMNRTGVKMKARIKMERKVGNVTDPITTMYDTVGTDATHIPANAADVGGYVSGSSGIEWTSAEWSRFSNARRIRIYQGNGPAPAPSEYDAIDVESGAVSPGTAAQLIDTRVKAGIHNTLVYGTDSNLALVTAETVKYGLGVWDGHVCYWLADWNLDEAGAKAKIGELIHGAVCVAVQWASPSSNPNTIVPGGTETLKAANIDLSVVDTTYIPSKGWGVAPTPPKPPVPTEIKGIVVSLPSGATHAVASTDAGKTWH